MGDARQVVPLPRAQTSRCFGQQRIRMRDIARNDLAVGQVDVVEVEIGLGGVLVEVLKDVTFRIVPLSRRDAREMIHDIQGFPVLAGYRGAAPADMEALQNILLTLSAFVESTPEIKEIDLNPIYAYAQRALAVDARVVLEEAPAST